NEERVTFVAQAPSRIATGHSCVENRPAEEVLQTFECDRSLVIAGDVNVGPGQQDFATELQRVGALLHGNGVRELVNSVRSNRFRPTDGSAQLKAVEPGDSYSGKAEERRIGLPGIQAVGGAVEGVAGGILSYVRGSELLDVTGHAYAQGIHHGGTRNVNPVPGYD